MATLPSLFISHGAPDIAIAQTQASDFLRTLAGDLPRPRAIVVASAHFEAAGMVHVTADAKPQTIHDFGGFDPRLHQMHYDAPGDPLLAERIVAALQTAGFAASALAGRGFDHGTWVPLILAFPQADIPVVQVSVDPEAGPDHHFRLGQALAPLREDGILVVGSGSFTHNLREAFAHVRTGDRQAPTPDWVSAFAEWMESRILAGDEQALLDYRAQAPFAERNHPSEEHLMPLYVALGAAAGAPARRLHDSRDFGVLSMAAFAFG